MWRELGAKLAGVGPSVPAAGVRQAPALLAEHFPPPVPYQNEPVEALVTARTLAGMGHVEVVGESRRQDALERVAGPKTPNGATRTEATAQLALDPGNPHDPRAVAVYIGRHHVGYLAREVAPQFHDAIDELEAINHPALCPAEITGGWSRDGSDGSFGVVLRCDTPGRRITLDDATIATPGRNLVDIQGEENCQSLLGALFQETFGEDFCVHLDIDDAGRVEVTLGPDRLGALTPKMSNRYGRFVQHLDDIDWPTNADAHVVPGAKKLEVKVRLPGPDSLASQHKALGLDAPQI